VKYVRACVLSFILITLSGTTSALASPIIDQSLSGNDLATAQSTGGPRFHVAQTFTVGLTGQLVGIDLRLNQGVANPVPNDGSVVVEVRSTSGGAPSLESTAPLASIDVPIETLPNTGTFINPFTHFDLGAESLPVVAGEMLAIAIHNRDPSGVDGMAGPTNGVEANLTTSGAYTNGAGFLGNYGSAWTPSSSEMDFQTYVDTAVPEPATGAILIASVIACLMAQRVRTPVTVHCEA
jgi:hypothetical protein